MRKNGSFAVWILLLLIPAVLTAKYNRRLLQFRIPKIRNFSVQEYRGHRQIWDICQDPSGRMWFANSANGLLVYDSARWLQVRLGNKTTARSVAAGADGRIYAGGINELGYVEQIGVDWKWVSLAGMVPNKYRNFSNVWQTVVTDQGVYYLTAQVLFRWYRQKLTAIPVPGGGARLLKTKQGLYLFPTGHGISSVSGNRILPVPGAGMIAKEENRSFIAFNIGSDRLLIVSRKRGVLILDRTGLQQVRGRGSALLQRSSPYKGVEISAGLYAIGTQYAGVVIINSAGELLGRISKAQGLSGNSITALFIDRLDNLWIGTGRGISRISRNDRLLFLAQGTGYAGTILRMAVVGNLIYFSTDAGLFFLDKRDIALGKVNYRKVKGLMCPVRAIVPFAGGLLVSTEAGLMLLRPGSRQFYPMKDDLRNFIVSRRFPGRVYGFSYKGFVAIEMNKGRLKLYSYEKGYNPNLKTCAEDRRGGVWYPLQAGSVARLQFFGDPGKQPLKKTFGKEHGVPDTTIWMLGAADRVYFWGKSGIYICRNGKFLPALDFGLQFSKAEIDGLIQNRDGSWWLKSDRFYRYDAKRTVLRPVPLLYPYFHRTFYAWCSDEDGNIWIGLSDGLLLFSPQKGAASERLLDAPIVSGVQSEVGLLYGKQIFGDGRSALMKFIPEHRRLRFLFALPDYNNEAWNRYRYWLAGSEAELSAKWRREPFAVFHDLSPGTYRLRVRAQSATGQLSKVQEIPFQILAPWYRSKWAYLFYFAAGLLLLIPAVLWMVRRVREKERARYREQRIRLELELARHQALLGKINTHFLFNTLNAIASLTGSDPERAEKMVEDLAEIFRYIVQSDAEGVIPLRREVAIAESYLQIESVRLGRRLRWHIEAEPETLDWPIPQLLLQPLLENSIKYNISRSIRGGEVRVVSRKKHDFLELEVFDLSADHAALPATGCGTGTALANIRSRLELLYPGSASFTSGPFSQGGQHGYRVVMCIPGGKSERRAR